MFEIHVICDPADADAIVKGLSAFATGPMRQLSGSGGERLRMYITAEHRTGLVAVAPPDLVADAYAGAPSVADEVNAVLDLAHCLYDAWEPRPEHVAREYRLRRAVVLDRIALIETDTRPGVAPGHAADIAEEAAISLALYDGKGVRGDGPTGPNAPVWAASGYRGYVRQEYAAWIRETTEGPDA